MQQFEANANDAIISWILCTTFGTTTGQNCQGSESMIPDAAANAAAEGKHPKPMSVPKMRAARRVPNHFKPMMYAYATHIIKARTKTTAIKNPKSIFLTAQVNDFAHMRLYLMVAAVIASLSNKLFYAKCGNRNSH